MLKKSIVINILQSLVVVGLGLTKARDPSNFILAAGLGWIIFFSILVYLFLILLPKMYVKKKWFSIFLIVFALVIVSFYLALDRSYDAMLMYGSLLKGLSFCAFIYFMVIYLKNKETQAQSMAYSILFSIIIIALHTLISKLFQLPVAHDISFFVANHWLYASGRLPTLFGEPSFYGYSAMLLSYSLYHLRQFLKKTHFVFTLGLLIFSLVLARSFICIFSSFFIIALLAKNDLFNNFSIREFLSPRRLVTLFGLAFIAIPAIIYFSFDYAAPRLGAVFSAGDGSTLNRLNGAIYFIESFTKIDLYTGGLGFKPFFEVEEMKGVYTLSGNVLFAVGGLWLFLAYSALFYLILGLSFFSITLWTISIFLQGEPFYPLLSILLAIGFFTRSRNEKHPDINLSANSISKFKNTP